LRASLTADFHLEPFTDGSAEPSVCGYLHRPANTASDGLILTHGAGSNAQAPLLVALADAFAETGFLVLRCDLPYRQLRPHGPPGPGDAARDRAGLKNTVAAMRKLAPGRIFLGGHSYGGRQSSMVCAAEPDLVTGLLLLSYPLHPPRKPDQLRTQHLPSLRTPSLFVSGTRDPFGTVEEIQRALELIPATTKFITVDGAGHDLNFKKGRNAGSGENLVHSIFRAFQEFFRDRR
jgi:predicted alpha/beta-hydrolase family hydrolase